MKRRTALAWGGIGALAALAGSGFRMVRQPEPAAEPVGEVWALRVERPGGGERRLAEFRGKPLVLNFWATWCQPCIKELPELDQLHRERAGKATVFALAVDKADAVQRFLAARTLTLPVGLAGYDGIALSRTLGNTQGGLPFTAVFDASGRTRHVKIGQTSLPELNAWLDAL